ncbi:hypothetical protein KA013_02310 [Patescibacteria group bacterium]|nr:hypothetical protein [Patescibacteria group bacterium]
MEKNALKFSKDEAFIQRIQQINDRIDPVLFAHMYSFSKVYEKIYKNVRTKGFNGAERMAYYDQHPDAKLSDIV